MRKLSFTFMEIIIAVSILLVVALTLFTYSQSVLKSWQQIMRERHSFGEILSLDRAIDGVLSNMVKFTWPDRNDVNNADVAFIIARPEMLRCAYLHQMADIDEGTLRFAEFYLEEGNLYMAYTDRPFLEWGEVGDQRKVTLLAEGVAGIYFQYADWSSEDGGNWEDRLMWLNEWETEESERKDIPLAVSMIVEWSDGRWESWMRRTMGNGYRERHGKWEPISDDKK